MNSLNIKMNKSQLVKGKLQNLMMEKKDKKEGVDLRLPWEIGKINNFNKILLSIQKQIRFKKNNMK